MKKRILIYGDSNVWGYAPDDQRLPSELRWPTILQEILGDGYEVIAEGESGRTAGDYNDAPVSLSGRMPFRAIIKAAESISTIIVALGTNDLKRRYHQSAQQITTSLLWYGETVNKIQDDSSTRIVYVLPPNFAYREGGMSDDIRREVIALMEKSVKAEECIVIHNIDLSEDGLHLSVVGHDQVAKIVHESIREPVSVSVNH